MTEAVFSLEPGEQVIWQACPAPRAYVFRHWRWSLVCLPAWWWLSFRLPGVRGAGGGGGWYAAAWLLAGWGTVGHLLAARLRWRWERYLVTDRWLRVRHGWRGRGSRRLPRSEVEICKVDAISGGVVTVQVCSRETGATLTLHCLEGGGALLRVLGEKGKSVDSPLDS